MSEIYNYTNFDKIKPLFKDIRFFMGNSVLDGVMGKAYVDNTLNPQIAFLVVRSYCFMSGNLSKEKLKDIINDNFKNFILIPSDSLKSKIESIYKDSIIKRQRFSIKKEVKFNENKLKDMVNKIPSKFEIIKINKKMNTIIELMQKKSENKKKE